MRKLLPLARPRDLKGSIAAILASLAAIGVDGLAAVTISGPVRLRVSRTIVGIAWVMEGLMGCIMTRRDPWTPGIFLVAGAAGGLVYIPFYFIIPAVLTVSGAFYIFFVGMNPPKARDFTLD